MIRCTSRLDSQIYNLYILLFYDYKLIQFSLVLGKRDVKMNFNNNWNTIFWPYRLIPSLELNCNMNLTSCFNFCDYFLGRKVEASKLKVRKLKLQLLIFIEKKDENCLNNVGFYFGCRLLWDTQLSFELGWKFFPPVEPLAS